MNYPMIFRILGWMLMFEAAFMAPSGVVAAIYQERDVVWLIASMGICLSAGALMVLVSRPKNKRIYAREGSVICALVWFLYSIFGALPFFLSGYIPNFIDAVFETASGFTTTGASILSDVEALPHWLLFWRSFTHWVGGMGILVFVMAIIPLAAGGSTMYLMKAESPGPSVSKLVPRVRKTAMLLYIIYFVMTVAEFILLLIGGMPVFDAINISVATAGTGGFSCNPAGMPYSPFCINVITVFMILFGVNFSCYFLLLHKKFKEAFTDELKVYLGIIAFAILTITLNVRHLPMFRGTGEALMHSAFTVGSLITTTGFSTVDFNQWPSYSRSLLVMLMFVGACAGSTGGGIKVSRIIILFRNMANELRVMTHPRQVKKVRMDGHHVDAEVIKSVQVYLAVYIMICVISILLLTIDGLDLSTNFTAVVATLNNIGPGLELVGPTSNYDVFSTPSKCVLIFDMLAGRLELFPIVLLLAPSTWKK